MQKQIELKEQKIPYMVRRSKRAKRIRITVECSDNFVLTLPRYADLNRASDFIKEKTDWILEKLKYFELNKNTLFPHSNRERYYANKAEALRLVTGKLEKLNSHYGFIYNSVAIRSQKTLWGSCSRGGHLSFNYKLVFLPDSLAEYLVAHELCHIKEMNHSDRFWSLVSETVPNYPALRRELKQKSLVFY